MTEGNVKSGLSDRVDFPQPILLNDSSNVKSGLSDRVDFPQPILLAEINEISNTELIS